MVFRLGIFAILIVALIVVSLFGLSVLDQSKQQQVAAAPAMSQILIAADLIQAGTLLQPADLGTGTVFTNDLPNGASLDTPENRSALIGSMARATISPAAAIALASVIHPGDHGFLAAVLSPGMRSVTVGVDAVSGAAGLIWPGDHVDVLLTQTLEDDSVPLGQRIAAELVLRDVRVIATGQQLVQGTVSNGGANKTADEATTVTLEVTPDQAERCEVATHLGPLSLVVHSSQFSPSSDGATASNVKPVWADEVSPALSNVHPASPVVSTVHVITGGSGEGEYQF